jgi:hypothetical protein
MYNTSEFKITLKNFEVEELFNHFDVLGLEEIELERPRIASTHFEDDNSKNVTLAKGI